MARTGRERIGRGLALAAALAAGAAPAAADPAVRCHVGVTTFLADGVRLFSTPFADRRGPGVHHWACRPGASRALRVGSARDRGTSYDAEIESLAVAGPHVAVLRKGDRSITQHLHVFDLRSGRRVTAARVRGIVFQFALAPSGDVIVAERGVVRLHPPGGLARVLSSGRGFAGRPAVAGDTVYWTERRDGGFFAGSATLDGPGGRSWRLERASTRVVPLPCDETEARPLAGSPDVRIVEAGDGLRVCRRGAPSLRVDGVTDGQIANNRWVLLHGPGRLTVLDAVGRLPRLDAVPGTPVRAAVMTFDGHPAWLEADGTLRALGAGGADRVLDTGATALAVGHDTYYWTAADGTPRRFDWFPDV